jgi:hypothetical protein
MWVSRRDFIKSFSTIAGPILVGATTIPGSILELSHVFGNHDHMSDEEQKLAKNLADDFATDDLNEYKIQQALEKHPESRRQIILDAFLWLMILPKGVLSKFFSEKFWSATLNMLIAIPLYLACSDQETRDLWSEEMFGAFQGVSMMNLVLQGSETVQVDVDRIAQRLLTHKRQQWLLTFYADNSEPKKILNSMNIYVNTDKSQNQSVVVNDAAAWITPHIFFLILPILSSSIDLSKKPQAILSIIRKHIHSIDAENKMHTIVDLTSIKNTHLKKTSDISKDVQEYSLNLLHSEIRTLTVLFYITQVPLFGVGQAAAFKKKVAQISELLWQIALAAGRPEYDADIFRKNILCLVTWYGPNRKAIGSDIAPNTGAFQRWKLPWFLAFLDEQWQPALASWVSFHQNIERICSHILPNYSVWDDMSSDWLQQEGQSFFSAVKSLTQHTVNFGSDTLHLWATILKDAWERLASDIPKNYPIYIDTTANEAWRKHILRGYNYDVVDPLDSEMMKNIFQNIPKVLSNMREKFPRNIIIDYVHDGKNKQFTFDNLLHLTYCIKEYRDDSDNLLSHKIFQTNEKHFLNLLVDLKETHTHPDIIDFLTMHFNAETKFTENDLFDLAYNDQIISPEIPGIADLAFSLESNKTVNGSIMGNIQLLAWNVKFLLYGKQHYPEKYASVSAIFCANCQNLLAYYNTTTSPDGSYSALSIVLGWLATHLDKDERMFFNDLRVSLWVDKESVLEDIDTDKESSAWKQAESIYNTMADKLWNLIPWQSKFRTKFEDGFEWFKHAAEQYLGKNSWEVIQMVLLLQSPFVLAVRRSAQRAISSISKSSSPFITESLICSVTYALSMFADNYIGLLVWVDLFRDLLWLDPVDAIRKVWKFSVYGGSQVVSGNAPNPLLSLWEKWYAIYDTLSAEEREQIVLSSKKMRILVPKSQLDAREAFKSKQSRQSGWAHGFDIVFDIIMLTSLNHWLWKIPWLALLASRGGEFGNNLVADGFDTVSTEISSTIATLLAPFKIVYGRKK